MEPDLSVDKLTTQYARHFLQPVLDAAGELKTDESYENPKSDDGAALIYGLEGNWVGDARTNTQVSTYAGVTLGTLFDEDMSTK